MYANSFSVFGDRSKYLSQLPLLIRQHHAFYPGWHFLLHSDCEFTTENPYSPVINELNDLGIIRVNVIKGSRLSDRPLQCIGMLWRMRPIWEGYDGVFCRDLDSILTPRQARFVTAFIQSDSPVHGINDNDGHNIPLMGGMVGFKSEEFKRLTRIDSFAKFIDMAGYSESKWEVKGADQDAMMSVIWPLVSGRALIHRPSGPNDRCELKDCCPGVAIEHVHPEIRQWGDTFTNYIGASNCNNTKYGEKTISQMISLYDTYGNLDVAQKILDVEKRHSIFWS